MDILDLFKIKTENVDINDEAPEYAEENYTDQGNEFNSYPAAAHTIFEPSGLPNSNYSVDVCSLCGAVGKLFIRIAENEELISKLQKYMSFIDLENNSDCICYQCSSTVNSWHGFYLNCSSVNAKLKKKCETKNSSTNRKLQIMNTESLNVIVESYDRLNSNPCPENFLQAMDVLTNSLKLLIQDMKTNPLNYSESQNNEPSPNTFPEMKDETPAYSKRTETPEISVNDTYTNMELRSAKEKSTPVPKKWQQFQSQRNGTWFCDNDGYCFRINKRKPGKIYVRCVEMTCPVRGCIIKNSFRPNKHSHTHPPNKYKHAKYYVPMQLDEPVKNISEEVIFHDLN